MNKKMVEDYLPRAIDALNDPKCLIREKDKDGQWTNKIQKTYRGQISAFGAAIVMGSFKSAVAFFSKDAGGSQVKRSELIRAMNYVIHDEWIEAEAYFKRIAKMSEADAVAEKENCINASLALKLAMNAYDLI